MIVRVDSPAWVSQLPHEDVNRFPALNDETLAWPDVRVADASASASDVLENPEIVNVAIARCDVAGVVAHNGRMVRVLVTGSRLCSLMCSEGIVQDVLMEATTVVDPSLRFSMFRRVTFRHCLLPDLDIA